MDNKHKVAFPWNEDFETWTDNHSGLTKRELFAMAAMQGFISAPSMAEKIENWAKDTGEEPCERIAAISVQYADALLDELENKQ